MSADPGAARPRAAWSGVALALVALLLPLALRPGPASLRAVDGTVALVELGAPGVLSAGDGQLLPPGNTLADPARPPAWRGHVVLALALFALGAAPGRTAWALRLAALAFLAAFFMHEPLRPQLQLVLGPLLAIAAGVGLGVLDARPPATRGGVGELLFAVGLVALTAPLTLVAIRAGATPPDEWLPQLLPPDATPPDGAFRALAAQVQRALDFAALSAFLAMIVLLLHLKTRRALTAALVVLWAAFELSAWPATVDALRRLAAG